MASLAKVSRCGNSPPDFKEFLQCLNARRVEYLLIGGYAVSIHGFDRYTGDIDVRIAVSRENAERVVAALSDFGFWSADFGADLFLDRGRMAHIGREPVKIEILNDVSGLEFEGAAGRAVTVSIAGLEVPVISLADLRANKLASGRAKDLADLDNLPEPGDPRALG